MDIEIIGCPIIRENDGLAKSSRNTYLSEDERKAAVILSKSLETGKSAIRNGVTDCKEIIAEIKSVIESEQLAKIDYVKIVDAETIQQIETLDRPALCAMAVYIGKTRLIDNFFTEDI